MSFEISPFTAAVIGIFFGAFVSFAIFLANLLATRFNKDNALIDIVVRLGCFGLLVLFVSELVGSTIGAQLRQHALLFWGSFAIGFVSLPISAALYNNKQKR